LSEKTNTTKSQDVKKTYANTLEATAKIQEQYFENLKKSTDYFMSMQKSWMDAANNMSAVSPDLLKTGITSEAYRSVYDFWMKQFETLGNLMGIPTFMPFRDSMKSANDLAGNYIRGFEIYNKTFSLWMDLAKKNIELLNNTMKELQKATTETYNGLLPLISVSDEERTKIYDMISETIKKNVETSTTMMTKQIDTLTKIVENLSSNVTKLAKTVQSGT
jgi:gas vesicle protein